MTNLHIYTCPSCSHQEPEFFPRCPACGKWLDPGEVEVEASTQHMHQQAPRTPARPATESDVADPPRTSTQFPEADRVLGGPETAPGICQGSALLFTGAPGVGKSTLLMQIAARIAATTGNVLLISAEESLPQAAARARRIDAQHPNLYILADNGLEEAVHEMHAIDARVVVIDSLQLMRTKSCDHAPGSAAQVKEVSAKVVELAKRTGTPFLVAGQIIKTGKFAGPMSVPHLYDAVFHLDDATLPGFILLRVEKNRFGSKSEVGSFRMTAGGIEEVPSPSAEILKGGGKGIIAVAMEGTKPIATEIQVGFLQRGDLSEAVVGYPKERLRLIQTILDQYGIEVPNTIALSVLGGYRISDSAADLAVAIATAYAVKAMLIPKSWGAIGEVALDGRLLPPHEFVARYRELEVLGIDHVIVPHVGSDTLPPSKRLKTYRARTLRDALRIIGMPLETPATGAPKATRQTKSEPVTKVTDALAKDAARKRRPTSPLTTSPPTEGGEPNDAPSEPASHLEETPPLPPPAPPTPAPSDQQHAPLLAPTPALVPAPMPDPRDPLHHRLIDLSNALGPMTPDQIRRHLGIGLQKAYQLHADLERIQKGASK